MPKPKDTLLYHVWEVHIPAWSEDSLVMRTEDEADARKELVECAVRRDGRPRDVELKEVYECRIGEWWVRADRVVAKLPAEGGARA